MIMCWYALYVRPRLRRGRAWRAMAAWLLEMAFWRWRYRPTRENRWYAVRAVRGRKLNDIRLSYHQAEIVQPAD